MGKKTVSAQQTVMAMCIAVAVAAAFGRVFFGTELTDEALYLGDGYLILNGAVPVLNNWTQFAPTSWLAALALKPFLVLTGGTEGIMLYSRLAYLGFKSVIAAVICLILRKWFPLKFVVPSAIAIMLMSYGNISNFSYTSISIYCFLLASVCMFAADQSKAKTGEKRIFAAVSGVLCAVGACCYPPHVITCAVLALILLVVEKKLRRSMELFVFYAVGGLSCACAVVAYLMAKGGGWWAIWNGIQNILSGIDYFSLRLRSPIMEVVWSTLIVGASLIVWLAMFVALLGVWAVRQHKQGLCLRSLDWGAGIFWCGWISYLLNLVVGAVIYLGFPGVIFTTYLRAFVIQIMGPPFLLAPAALWLVHKKHPVCKPLFLTLWLPLGVWLLVTGFFVHDGYAYRCIALLGGQLCYLLFSFLYVQDKMPAERAGWFRLAALGATMCAAVISLYGYVYGDAPVPELDYRMGEGVYRGLYTTRERAEGLAQLEKDIQVLTEKEESVLFLDNVPMAYLMADAIHCTPSSWDMALYANQHNDPSIYLNYFQTVQQIPDKIIYIQTDPNTHVSKDEPGYLFNDFVDEHYVESERIEDSIYPVRVFTRTSE